MRAVKTVEIKLGEAFKNAPALPDNSKEALVKAWPWIALVFGVLQLLAAWGLWGLVRTAERLNDLANTLSTYYTTRTYGMSAADRTVIYLAVAVLILDGVILLMAYPELAKRKPRGWDLLFLGALLNVAYALVSLFIDERGIGTFIFSLLGSAVGFYLLFQVRSKYKSPSAAQAKKPAVKA